MQIEKSAYEFINRWKGVVASELSVSQSFLIELCEWLEVARPHPTPEQDYMFERPLKFTHGDGSQSDGRIDCYKRGHFALESKKTNTEKQTPGFDKAMLKARSQAEAYARALPAAEGRPPFVVVVDVGHVFELYAEFSCTGGTYVPFPDARRHRIQLDDLAQPSVQALLKQLWTDPMGLDPARASARVTHEVAVQLAGLARELEAQAQDPQDVSAFLTRCLFTMFAEDLKLLPSADNGSGAFTHMLTKHREDPATLQRMMVALWTDMDQGGFSAALAAEVRKFNGKLFKSSDPKRFALRLNKSQIDKLLAAASADWTTVEPAIFGTLLERALDPTERHALGAHYTPRAYVERLVMPTVIQPLRAQWAHVQAAVALLTSEAQTLAGKKRDDKLEQARAEVRQFHHHLCHIRVLDPACGSGNFLYVTLEHLKRLEGEVFTQLEDLGWNTDAALQGQLGLEGVTISLQQLRGIELNSRAAALAELVLWIGFLQWQARTVGVANIAEPVVHDYGNIENRDAVLAFDGTEPQRDEAGQPITRWDGVTTKIHPVTGLPVPDDSAQVTQLRYRNPRKALWPKVDFIVGNPPFIGNKRMREALGDGYVDALRAAWPSVPDSADFVMYWWQQAAETVRTGQAAQFGLITTNSLTMIFNRRVIESQQSATPPLSLIHAIPDHPWVDSANGAAVRIAMTVGAAGQTPGQLTLVSQESEGNNGEVNVVLTSQVGAIHADLKIGANINSAKQLKANGGISTNGFMLAGSGFTVPSESLSKLEKDAPIKTYRNGKDLMSTPRHVHLIDFYGVDPHEARLRWPATYQWILERVKPERDQNNRNRLREKWWLFGEVRKTLRAALHKLPRYIATVETAKHRVFQFLNADIAPDHMLIAIGSCNAVWLGVLSSQVHTEWALASGGRLGVGNDPRYNKSKCFETFPFPFDDTGLTPALTERIRALAEQLDAHRKQQQAAHPTLTLTGMYNVLDKLRTGDALNAKDKIIHEQGLVSVLRTLHDELDEAVMQSYGWDDLGPVPWAEDAARASWTDALLTRLVDLNARRAAEEGLGTIRWLRPEFQNPAQPALASMTEQSQIDLGDEDDSPALLATRAGLQQRAWPDTLPAQIKVVADIISQSAVPLTLEDIACQFKARGRWKDRLPTILDTLVAIGRIQTHDGIYFDIYHLHGVAA